MGICACTVENECIYAHQVVNYAIPFISEASVEGHDRDTTDIQSRGFIRREGTR